MKTLALLCIAILVSCCGSLAHAWCFEETTVGGYLPFFIITLTPIVSATLGFLIAGEK